MKKFLFGIALVFSLLVIATGFTENPADKKIGINSQMPVFQVSNQTNSMTVGNQADNYILVSFWDSSDAESRLACTMYQGIINNDVNSNIEFVAINFDINVDLFAEIVRIDNLDTNLQYRLDSNTAMQLRAIFDLDKGMGSVLVAPDGTIAAFNPSSEYLKALMS